VNIRQNDILNNKNLSSFAEVAELEVLALAFSTISWRFVTASGVPDFRLVSAQFFLTVSFKGLVNLNSLH
jgi:hypothetical protein